MPRVIEKTLYRFNELSDKAKKRARQEFTEGSEYPHHDWWTFDDFIECAKCLGIEIGDRRGSKEPAIYFSGFSSQGDGASFKGSYACRPDAVTAIKAHAPMDEELHRIAEEMTAIQVRSKLTDGSSSISARIIANDAHYCHSNTMSFDIHWTNNEGELCEGCIDEGLAQLFRDFADWMYEELEAQHDYYFSDEYIEQELQDRELEFDEEGSII